MSQVGSPGWFTRLDIGSRLDRSWMEDGTVKTVKNSVIPAERALGQKQLANWQHWRCGTKGLWHSEQQTAAREVTTSSS